MPWIQLAEAVEMARKVSRKLVERCIFENSGELAGDEVGARD